MADALVLPSERETWGLAVNEAMTFGVPAIVSDTVGCAPDLVVPGVTGAVFKSGNAGALSTAIESVRRLSAHNADQLRKNVLTHISKYSLDASVDGIVAAIQSIANR
jgi:glycosyltransferase involved in cell wall biosynthesis